MPGQLQEGFCCVVTNRFDQLFDDEEDPFDVLKQAEKKMKDGTVPGAAKTAAQAAKQAKKESQKERRNLVLEKKERHKLLFLSRKMVNIACIELVICSHFF